MRLLCDLRYKSIDAGRNWKPTNVLCSWLGSLLRYFLYRLSFRVACTALENLTHSARCGMDFQPEKPRLGIGLWVSVSIRSNPDGSPISFSRCGNLTTQSVIHEISIKQNSYYQWLVLKYFKSKTSLGAWFCDVFWSEYGKADVLTLIFLPSMFQSTRLRVRLLCANTQDVLERLLSIWKG